MKKAIVMGATSGIGMEVAKCLAENGWSVGVAGRRRERLEELISAYPLTADRKGGIVAFRQIDVTNEDASALLVDLINEMGGMDLYFHSSGIGWQNNLLDTDKELMTVDTNCGGFTRMIDTAFNYMAASHKGGQIGAITSIAGTKGLGAAPAYSAAKRFQSHYLECLSQLSKMRNLSIDITDIRPGFVATDLISGNKYPLQLKAKDVAEDIVCALRKRKAVRIIDWHYRILVFVWRLIPRWLWIRLRVTN